MHGHLPAMPSQTDKRTLIRRYGYGAPDLELRHPEPEQRRDNLSSL
jgi:hypothetical protein